MEVLWYTTEADILIFGLSPHISTRRYMTKRYNLDLFHARLERQGVHYTIVERTFEGSEFQSPADWRFLRIRVGDVMWQKERLLNCALETVPASVSKIAWLDSDVIFEDDDWHHKASTTHNHFSIVQPYDWSVC